MAVYRFVNKNGEFKDIEYTNPYSSNDDDDIDKVLCDTWKDLKDYFPLYSFEIEKMEKYIYKASIQGDGVEKSFSDIDLLYMLTTPGGRSNLTYEQRIQPTGDALRSIFDKSKDDHHVAVLIGLYSFEENRIFCAWTVSDSDAKGTSSKQIKIDTIQSAVRNGFALQEKTRNTDYACAFRPEFLMFYLNNYKSIHRNDFLSLKTESKAKEGEGDESSTLFDKSFTENRQVIYYGVPGSGKSNTIEDLTPESKVPSNQKVRVVFHPDYSNADFVGQIMPKKVGASISYDFKAGPFTDILKRAYDEPDKPFYLIVEEINRGNAAAIFGDVFQLLDRDDEGWSKYGITNEEVSKIIHGDELAKEMGFMVKLPPNLSILATMNTSDQNVFTLDNAFQRRWKMIHVKNKFQDDEKSKVQRKSTIKGTSLTWEDFLFGDGDKPGINAIISSSSYNSGMSSLEDKRIGCWFVVNQKGKIQAEDFSDKVLKYLWDDAFHFDKSVFADGIESFDDLIDAFENGEQLFKELHIDYESENDNEPTQSGE